MYEVLKESAMAHPALIISLALRRDVRKRDLTQGRKDANESFKKNCQSKPRPRPVSRLQELTMMR